MYLDHAATARFHPCVKPFLNALPDLLANPSSSHGAGLAVRRRINAVREIVAEAIGVFPEEIYFTGSATEANAIVHLGLPTRGHVVTSEVEHSSIEQNLLLAQRRGIRLTRVPLRNGTLSPEQILAAIEPDTRLVSVMTINNETGHRFDLEGLAGELRRRNIAFHRDAVQTLGKFPFSAAQLSSAVFSPHKIGSLSGVGILYLSRNHPLPAIYAGGGQERGLRSGTHSTAAILCAGEVIRETLKHREENRLRVRDMREHLLRLASDLGAKALSPPDGSEYILNISFPDLPAEVVVNALSHAGISVSAGSACSSAARGVSRVIRGITPDPVLEKGAVRFSFSPYDKPEDVQAVCPVISEVINGLRRGIA